MIFNYKKVFCHAVSLMVLLPQTAEVCGQTPDPNNDEKCPDKMPQVWAPGKCNGLAMLTDCHYGQKPCSHDASETCYQTTCTCFGEDLACTADSDSDGGGGDVSIMPVIEDSVSEPATKPPLNDEVSIASNNELCPAERPNVDLPRPSCDSTLLTSDCMYELRPCRLNPDEMCYMWRCTCFGTELVCAQSGNTGGGGSSPGSGGGAFLPETDAPVTAAPVTAAPITDDDEGESGGGFPICFPGDALVQVKSSSSSDDTKMIPMKDLKIGDVVRVQGGNNIPKYEPIYSFGHRNIHDSTEFLELKTSSSSKVTLSSQHMVYETSQQKFIPASEIKRGHSLQFYSDKESSTKVVTSIRTVEKQGMYAPFTSSGTIVVNSIVASSYVAIPILESIVASLGISYQWMAHNGEFPHRLVCHYMGSCQNSETYDDKTGINQGWCTIPLQILNYDISTISTAVQWLLAFFTLSTLVAFYITEQALVHNGHVVVAGFVFIGMMMIMKTKSSTLLRSKKKQI